MAKKKLVKLKKQSKNLTDMFGGANVLMKRSEKEIDDTQKRYIVAVAKVLNISPLAVTILGGLPYVQNLGKKQLLQQLYKGATFRYNWIKRSETDEDKAICEAKIVKGNKELTDWIAGECSPSSMKMGTLKGYQNHMAQTRAENRAIQNLCEIEIHNKLLKGINAMVSTGKISEGEARNMLTAATASAEEMINQEPKTVTQKVEEMKPSGDDAKLKAITQGIVGIKNVKDAENKLKLIKEDKSLSKEVKSAVVNLLETKINMLKRNE